jgi:hypothetical protein
VLKLRAARLQMPPSAKPADAILGFSK